MHTQQWHTMQPISPHGREDEIGASPHAASPTRWRGAVRVVRRARRSLGALAAGATLSDGCRRGAR